MFFVILVDDDYCVAIHDLSPVLTALFSFELGGFNSQHRAEDAQSTFRLRVLITMVCSAVFLCLRDFGAAVQPWKLTKIIRLEFGIVVSFYNLVLCWFGLAWKLKCLVMCM